MRRKVKSVLWLLVQFKQSILSNLVAILSKLVSFCIFKNNFCRHYERKCKRMSIMTVGFFDIPEGTEGPVKDNWKLSFTSGSTKTDSYFPIQGKDFAKRKMMEKCKTKV